MIDPVDSLPTNDEFDDETSSSQTSELASTSGESQSSTQIMETDDASNLANQDRAIESGAHESSASHGTLRQPETQPANRVPSSVQTQGSFTRATLGSALLALDTLSERLEQAEAEAAAETPPRRPEDVFIPMSEWDERFGDSTAKTARYLMLGMMTDAGSKTKKGGSFVRDVSLSMAGVINTLLAPIRRSRTFRPLRRGFDSALERGDSQVKRWVNLGRSQDLSSRRLAQATLNQVADDTMDELVMNPRIQLFIQEIISAQSQGMIDEGIEELRERTISVDNFIESPVRGILRRPSRDTIPGPDFDPQLVRAIHKRHIPIRENSLMAYYAGFMSRLLAFALDVAFLAVFLAMGSWLLTTVGQLLGFENLVTFIRGISPFTFTFGTATVGLAGALIIFGYILGFWVLTGQTLGMMLMGLRVVTKDGDNLTFGKAILRLIGMFIAAFPFYLGFVWILFDNHRQGWQDKIGGTYVVYAWDAQPDETFLREYVFRRN